MYREWLNCSIWPVDGILTGTTTSGQNELWSNDNDKVLAIPQTSRIGVSPSEGLMSFPG